MISLSSKPRQHWRVTTSALNYHSLIYWAPLSLLLQAHGTVQWFTTLKHCCCSLYKIINVHADFRDVGALTLLPWWIFSHCFGKYWPSYLVGGGAQIQFWKNFTFCPVSLPGVGTLQEVVVPIIGQRACHRMYSVESHNDDVVNILPDMICAGYQDGGKDSCQVRPRLSSSLITQHSWRSLMVADWRGQSEIHTGDLDGQWVPHKKIDIHWITLLQN